MLKLLSILALCLPLSATTYYVSNVGSDAANGTSTGTPWANAPGMPNCASTCASTTLVAGDSVLMLAGSLWRQLLTVPTSGSAGNPITFGAYGSGAKPIISGADLLTSFAQTSGSILNETFGGSSIPAYFTPSAGGSSTVTEGSGYAQFVSGAGNQARIESNTLGSVSEQWLYYQVNIAATGIGNGNRLAGPMGIEAASGVVICGLFIDKSGGALKWDSVYSDNSAQNVTVTAVSPTAGTWYEVLLHYKLATGPGANNGIAQIWVNGTAILNLTNVNNDTVGSPGRLRLGINSVGGGTPTATIYMRNLMTGAAPAGTNYWSKALIPVTTRVYFDHTKGVGVASVGALATANNWYQDTTAHVLYIYEVSNPSSFSAPGIEASQRDTAVTISGKSFVTLDGLSLQGANSYGAVLLTSSTASSIVHNCDLLYSDSGAWVNSNAGGDNAIRSNTVAHNDKGIYGYLHSGSTSGHETLVQRNTVSDSVYDGIHLHTNYWIVEFNDVSSSGVGSSGSIGIHPYNDLAHSGTLGLHNVVRYNVTHENQTTSMDGSGIETDNYTDYTDIYGNVSWGNYASGIDIHDSTHVNVYNNTSYGNCQNTVQLCAEVFLNGGDLDTTANVNVKNNIGYATTASIPAVFVDSNTTNNSGIVITNNLWYRASGNWWQWGVTLGSVLATWNTDTGGVDFNTNPSLASPPSNVTLQVGSPAIGTGLNLGPVYSMTLSPLVTTEPFSLILQCPAWNIGAFGQAGCGAALFFSIF